MSYNKYYNYSMNTEVNAVLREYNKFGYKLGYLESGVVSLVISFEHTDSPLYMSYEKLADTFMVSRGTIIKAVKQLCEIGLINKTFENRHKVLKLNHKEYNKMLKLAEKSYEQNSTSLKS